jgi:hypothetical protein
MKQLLTACPEKLGHSLWEPSPAALPSDPSVSARTIVQEVKKQMRHRNPGQLGAEK